MALAQTVWEEIDFEIVDGRPDKRPVLLVISGEMTKKRTKWENGLCLGQGHVAQGPFIENLSDIFMTHIL